MDEKQNRKIVANEKWNKTEKIVANEKSIKGNAKWRREKGKK